LFPRKDGDAKIEAHEKPYRLWYDYLKETNIEDWSAEVKEDFAGVFSESFEQWFSHARFDLWTPRKAHTAPVREYKSGNDVVLKENELLLVLDLTKPKDALLRSIEFLLWLRQEPRGAGRPEFRQNQVKYPFARRPDTSSLEIALAAWRLASKHEDDPEWPTWRIGQELSKAFGIMKNDMIKECNDGSYNDLDIVPKQKELDKNARRYLKLAEAVLDGVTKGIFPAK
jgi:hypothetical protein